MAFETSLKDFLADNRITPEVWAHADITWESLQAIAADYLARQTELTETAQFCARVMQQLPAVHSVRWRVKDVQHLLEKIVRKRAEKAEGSKYAAIGPDNYHQIVTDLVGLRALHLFKDECFEIDAALRGVFAFLDSEPPVAYVREGDPPGLLAKFTAAGLEVKHHKAGYRSVHYVVATRPLQKPVAVEVQVRTIFEEGWSEIDHRTRYPNFSDNQQVGYFLDIFNRMAGSADEMGSFVRGLVTMLDTQQREASESSARMSSLQDMVEDLQAKLKANKATAGDAEKLRRELEAVRAASLLASTHSGVPGHGFGLFDHSGAVAAHKGRIVPPLLGATISSLGGSSSAALGLLRVGETANVAAIAPAISFGMGETSSNAALSPLARYVASAPPAFPFAPEPPASPGSGTKRPANGKKST